MSRTVLDVSGGESAQVVKSVGSGRGERDTAAARDGGSETRANILLVARELFLELGYSRTSMVAIADRVGIRAPALYWHFASKEAILFAVIDKALVDFLGAITISDAEDATSQMSELVRRYVTYQLERSSEATGYSSLIEIAKNGRVLTPEHELQLRARQREVQHIFKRVLERGQSTSSFDVNDATVTAFALVTLCEHVNTWAHAKGPKQTAEIAEEYVLLALRMIRATSR